MSTKGTVLLVDDESYVRDSLATVLSRKGFEVRTAESAQAGLSRGNLEGVDAVITDLRMPGEDGLSLLKQIVSAEPDLPVIVLTGHGTVLSAVECMKAGAFEYLLKPANNEQLLLILERALKQSTMQRELKYLRSSGKEATGREGPVGVSRGWKKVLELVEAVAQADTTILLLGESGTGKEEVAQLIHRKSFRADHPFVRVNCAAVPLDLFESEFFGHRKGAYSGALADREGRFRVAHLGTLFLDEIGSMSETAQAKVLRVLQDGTFERVGESLSTSVDVRVIAASNADLAKEVEAGRFRRDLFYRINVVTIQIPPLRERLDDIPVLTEYFLDKFCRRLGKPGLQLTSESLAALQSYDWPGNVRELRNVMERAVLLERGDRIQPSSLPFATEPSATGRSDETLNLREHLAAEERRILSEALGRAEGVRREAARLLGIDERNLSYFLKKHGLMGERKSQ